ncbi:MAG: histidinol phosphatase [Flavobacteriaceae bacterium]|nr:histidinol phosphatase [Flavobacteriaceae bacterium]|tara:strand:+ start:234 stop:974 length:741 start_codon:yes stop_codon:yes gene_type:complete
MIFFKKRNIQLNDFFPEGFVDIHSHLLPGIDDGAKDLDHSIELIKKMASYGIKNIITTPHVLGDVYPNTSKIITSKLEEVQTELKNRGMKDIKLRAAAEYMMDEQFVELLKKKDLLTLKDNYILVEMSYFSPPLNLYDILFEIQLQGYKPILAHPERYITYHKNYKEYQKLKASGCLFQLNLLALSGYYGEAVKRVTKLLLEDNFYDLVGTDSHHKRHLENLKGIGSKKIQKQIKEIVRNNIELFS